MFLAALTPGHGGQSANVFWSLSFPIYTVNSEVTIALIPRAFYDGNWGQVRCEPRRPSQVGARLQECVVCVFTQETVSGPSSVEDFFLS